ncbi:nucleotidyltransferase family protein [Caldimonas brevitalea]|uniref:Molybdopterin-guanine dinucleotide biosynthesis protein MobA n=1 Tax=Caldimonas brevitalea TaxID=413882 RepID=A0A0G3BL92_9BURK|nr:nucleotidyltransferase family protein [Caldimonas brevitalea]AKJ28151.1 molybdopterin-guanine dinucleotide biosynthesis protein MobA [Caldimonas brevitalea]
MKAVPVVVVLAAGAGTRFTGHPHKLTQPFANSTVLGTTLAQVKAAGMPLVVVTTPPLQDTLTLWVAREDVVVVPEAPRLRAGAPSPLGMGYSIAAGVRARGDAPGWMVLPGDMPLVQPGTLRAVVEGLTHHPIAYAQYRGRRGHPVAFAAELFSELATLTGDVGARRIVARYPSLAVDVHDPGVLMDLDTEDDLQRLREMEPGRPHSPPQPEGRATPA